MGSHAMRHNDPNNVPIELGNTKELVWKFTQAADLEFTCSVPGHYQPGVVGKVQSRR